MDSGSSRIYAGVQVPKTAIIDKALSYTRTRLNDMAYKHDVRS